MKFFKVSQNSDDYLISDNTSVSSVELNNVDDTMVISIWAQRAHVSIDTMLMYYGDCLILDADDAPFKVVVGDKIDITEVDPERWGEYMNIYQALHMKIRKDRITIYCADGRLYEYPYNLIDHVFIDDRFLPAHLTF